MITEKRRTKVMGLMLLHMHVSVIKSE